MSDRTRNHYLSVTYAVRDAFQRSPLWTALMQDLRDLGSRYFLQTRNRLLVSDDVPELTIKPYESFLLKTFRKNVLLNVNWPDAPPDGWLLPDNWFTRINDIVRTLLVVKYLDGVEFIAEILRDYCEAYDVRYHMDWEAKEEGYYAAHLYMVQEFDVPRPTFDSERREISIELQVTTQLQDVIRALLHRHYEARRQVSPASELKWQWDYSSEEFATNYLGHILHYVEGMIMGIRETQRRRE